MESLISRGEAKYEKFLFFLAGFLSAFLVIAFIFLNLASTNSENPFSVGFSGQQSNESAPGDWIKSNQILLTSNSIVIKIANASLSSYAPTGSMRPVFDSAANGIRIVPEKAEQIKIGDIITYSENNIVHRVIDKGEDEQGTWFLAKGDNNAYSDSLKIRFKDIRYVTIGVLY